MKDQMTVIVKIGYQEIAEFADDDVAIEVLGIIKAKRGTAVPKTADQVLIEQLEKQLSKQETANYELKCQLEKLTKLLAKPVEAPL